MLLNFGLKLLTPHQGIPGAVQSGLQTQDVREQDVQLRLQSSGWFGETSHASTKPGWAATLKTETGTTALILAFSPEEKEKRSPRFGDVDVPGCRVIFSANDQKAAT